MLERLDFALASIAEFLGSVRPYVGGLSRGRITRSLVFCASFLGGRCRTVRTGLILGFVALGAFRVVCVVSRSLDRGCLTRRS